MFTGLLKHLSRSHGLRTRTMIQISTERYVFCGTGPKQPLFKATKTSGGLLVTGEGTNTIKIASLFMQYCGRFKAQPKSLSSWHTSINLRGLIFYTCHTWGCKVEQDFFLLKDFYTRGTPSLPYYSQ